MSDYNNRLYLDLKRREANSVTLDLLLSFLDYSIHTIHKAFTTKAQCKECNNKRIKPTTCNVNAAINSAQIGSQKMALSNLRCK